MTRLRAFDPRAALALIAGANMALAIALIPRDPMRAWDLWSLRGWVREWLVERHRLYDWPASGFDYPPWAIVTFAPVGLLPADRAVLIWAAVNLLAIGVALVAFARLTASSGTGRLMLVPVLLVLCWGGTRTLLMFTPVTLAAGALGILCTRRPAVSGVLLGIAAAKPQIYAARDAWPPFGRRAMLILLQVALTLDIVPRVVRAMPPGLLMDIVANLNRAVAFCALGYLALVIRAETSAGRLRRDPPEPVTSTS